MTTTATPTESGTRPHDGAPAAAAAAARAPGSARPESMIDLVRDVLHDLPGLIGDRVELFSLELHRAGLALLKVLAMTVAAAILGVTAWLAVWSILVGLLMAAGWHWAAANGLVVLINIAAAAYALVRARRLMSHLSLPATRQHLSLGSGSTRRSAESESPSHEHPPIPERPAAAA
jgi:uncharacterized membrane protein YqjE